MKIKTANLIGPALDYSVARALGHEHVVFRNGTVWVMKPSTCNKPGCAVVHRSGEKVAYSTNWAQGGLIIESEKITVVCAEGAYNQSKAGTPDCFDTYWVADIGRLSREESYGPQGDHWGEQFSIDGDCVTGPTPLITAMRCLVASRLGDEVEIPDELINDSEAAH